MGSDVDEIVRTERDGEIGLICLAKPPVNALGVALRGAVYQALQTLLSDDAIKVIVLYGAGRLFSAGADIKDFARVAEAPTLPDLLKALNDSPKPTIAALHGAAFGGALELALATHLRVGVTGLKIGLPEVKLGLLPGAGGTQRLPRLTGMAAAIDIICTGRHVSGEEALELGILNRLEDGNVRDIGVQAARDVLSGAIAAIPTDKMSTQPDPRAVETARKKYSGGLAAPLKAIEAIQSAITPIGLGLQKERSLFMELMQGEERAGLVHAFLAERATAKIPEATADRRDVSKVGVIGGGTMGIGIATAFLLAGFPVTLIETAADRVEIAREGVMANLAGALKRGKLTNASHAAALARFGASSDLAEMAHVDLVIEAIFEDIDAKTDLFRALDGICRPGAIMATNTSYLDVNDIAAATSRPRDVIGLHFFSPAHIMRLLEVVVAKETVPEVVATAFDLARKLRKVPVRAGVCEGFIGNRILARYRRICEYLVLDGAHFEQVDRALEEFGFAMGPFAVGDLAGLDIAKAMRDRKATSRLAGERYSRVADLICDEGWFGRKTGRGYYLYEGGKNVGPNPGAVDIIAVERADMPQKSFGNDEIVARILTAMVQEAAMILEEGIALRPIDIDAVLLFGYGFPRHCGGPMHMADKIGLAEVVSRIETYSKEDANFWKVPALLRDMVERGQCFADLETGKPTGL